MNNVRVEDLVHCDDVLHINCDYVGCEKSEALRLWVWVIINMVDYYTDMEER